MKPTNPTDLRPQLAAAVVLALLAVAYQLARQLRVPAPVVAAELPARPAVAKLPAPVPAAPVVRATPAPCPPSRLVFRKGSPAARRPWVVRRYVGTVGGRPATAWLQWQTPDSITGTFYLHRGGPEYHLTFNRAQPGPVRLAVAFKQGPDYYSEQGKWHLATNTLAKPLLAGTWQGAGRPQRLLLSENYRGALRHAFKEQALAGDTRLPEACDYVPEVEHQFLTLPSSGATPPALRRRLADSPAALRRRIRQDYGKNDGDATASFWDEVRLNDFQLFSYQTFSYARTYGGTPDRTYESWLFDLRTGKELLVEDQLKPDYERPLQRLLTRHLLHDPAFQEAREAHEWDWRDDQDRPTALISLPDQDEEPLTLTGAGLEVTYSYWTMHNGGAGGLERETVVLVPYRELRPLVRPGTPLARMLAARGMW